MENSCIEGTYNDTPEYIIEQIEEDSPETEEEDYSLWIKDGSEYIPATNIETVRSIPSGVYKIVYRRDDYRAIPVPINTDELYIFSEDYTSTILEESKSFWDKAQLYKDNHLIHKRGILLSGRAGCGKTSIITMLIKQIVDNGGLVFMVSNTDDFNILSGCLNSIIRKIEQNRPIITVIEDVDQIISEFGDNDYRLLDFMDGKASIDNHLIILTSNDTTKLSEALLRPSRIDLTFEIPNPNIKIRKEFFKHKGIKDEEKINEYAKVTKNFTFAELKEFFIGTEILGKPVDKVIKQITTPFDCKDYLNKIKSMKGIE